MSQLPSCQVCGGNSYEKKSGYYVCMNCDTQSQEFQEQSFAFTGTRQDEDDEHEEITIHEGEKERDLTSWECYNFVLRRLIDELISLGASTNLKVVAFQIWARYLQTAEIAFISKDLEKLPALPLGFRNKDVEVLYGVKHLKRKLFNDSFGSKPLKRSRKKSVVEDDSENDLSTHSFSSAASKRSLRHKQRRLAALELSNASTDDDYTSFSENESIHTLESGSSKQTKVMFTADSQSEIGKLVKSATRRKSVDEKDTLKVWRSKYNTRAYNSKRLRLRKSADMSVTLNTLISILRIALYLLDEEIQLGDLLRWCSESRLSIHHPEKCMPTEKRLPRLLPIIHHGRSGFDLDLKKVTKDMNLNNIPTPNLYALVKRYCTELHLPNEFTNLVCKVMNALPPKMDYKEYGFRKFPSYEYRALAYIMYAAKLLFGLNDDSEYQQSRFADAVNRYASENNLDDIPRLFSWTKWVHYVKCRKAILAKYNVNFNNDWYGGKIDDKTVFERYWETSKPLYGKKSFHINHQLLQCIKTRVHELATCDPANASEVNIELPATLYPFRDYTNYLLTNHLSLIPQRIVPILESVFTSDEIKYTFNNERCMDIAGRCGYTVVFSEVNVFGLQELNKSDNACESYRISNVELIDGEECCDTKKKQKWRWFRSEPEEDTQITNDADSSANLNLLSDPVVSSTPLVRSAHVSDQNKSDDTFTLPNPKSCYWFLHEVQARTLVHEFEDEISQRLPSSFQWLLVECARLISAEPKDLYAELQLVESVYCSLFDDEEYANNAPIYLFANEW